MWYLTIYAGISGAQTALELVRGFSSNFLAIRAARHLHNGMLARLLRCGPTSGIPNTLNCLPEPDDFWGGWLAMWHPHQCNGSSGLLTSLNLQATQVVQRK
jgi:hypothetical protein